MKRNHTFEWNISHVSAGIVSLKIISDVVNSIRKDKSLESESIIVKLNHLWLNHLIELNLLPLKQCNNDILSIDSNSFYLSYNRISFPKVTSINNYLGKPKANMLKPILPKFGSNSNNHDELFLEENTIKFNEKFNSSTEIINHHKFSDCVYKKNQRSRYNNNKNFNQCDIPPVHGLKVYMKTFTDSLNTFYWKCARVINFKLNKSDYLVKIRLTDGHEEEITWPNENVSIKKPDDYVCFSNDMDNIETLSGDNDSIDDVLNNLLELENEIENYYTDNINSTDENTKIASITNLDICDEINEEFDYLGYDQNILNDIEEHFDSLKQKKVKFVIKECRSNKESNEIIICPEEDPLVPLESPDILIIGQCKRMTKYMNHWRISLYSTIIQFNQKEYIFPTVSIYVDISSIFDDIDQKIIS